MLQLRLIAQINQSEAAAEDGTCNTILRVKEERREMLKLTYHPGFAAEVVDGEERVDARDATKMQANHKVPKVLARNHAVGMLAN